MENQAQRSLRQVQSSLEPLAFLIAEMERLLANPDDACGYVSNADGVASNARRLKYMRKCLNRDLREFFNVV